jgi:hypothetical protein
MTTLGIWAVSPGVARAEERARLVYVREPGAEKCPAEIDLRLRVVARLGYDPFSPQASRVVLARISATTRALDGSVELVDERGISSGKRALGSPPENCEQLARAMALSISLAIDPERELAPEPTPSRAAPRSEAEKTSPAPMPRPSAVPPARAARGHRFFAGVALAGSVGALPEPGLGAFGFVGYRGRWASLSLEARAQQSFGQDLSPRGSLHGSLIGPGLSGCGIVRDFAVCAVSVIAVQRLVSEDVSDPKASAGLFAGIGPRLTWRLGLQKDGFGLSFSAEGLVNVSPNTARFSDTNVWKTPVFSGHALIGIETPFL